MHYSDVISVYESLEATTKRLEKTNIICEFLKTVKVDDLDNAILLIQGKVFPNWDDSKIGVAARLIIKAISVATGITPDVIEKEWKDVGDLGLVAEKLVSKKKQVTLVSTDLTVDKVFANLRKLATLEGAGTVDVKMKLIAELLTSAKPTEARYIVRMVLEDMRIGVGEGSIRDAITWAYFGEDAGVTYADGAIEVEDREKYNSYVDSVQRGFDLTNDFSIVAKAASNGLSELSKVPITVFRPLKVMLAIKAGSVAEGIKRCGPKVDVEYKLDGFRMQIHKSGDSVRLYTRRLEEVTTQFPEVVEYVKEYVNGEEFILDAEAAGFDPKTGKYFPFQHISQRIRRKYGIAEMSKEFPVELNVFDILFYEGKNMISEPFIERRTKIEEIVTVQKQKISVVKNLITESEADVQKFYEESLAAGNEGIMFKTLDAPYKPGSRVGHMVKMKPIMETLDLVIIGAEWGQGKRANWLSSFTLACVDDDGTFLEIGKMGTGIKEKAEEGVSFDQMTEILKPFIISEKGREVEIKPHLVIEVSYEEIQKSPTYSSGFALRFPRLVGLREDRNPEEVATIEMVEDFYSGQ